MKPLIIKVPNSTNRIPYLRFPEFSRDWEVKKLGELSQLITKGTTPKKFVNQGIKFIKIECFDGDKINIQKCLFIDEYVHKKELKRSILKENDLLFAIAGATIGKVNIVTEEILPANTNQALAIIRLKENKNPKFIYQILKSNIMRKYIKDSISVGAQPNLNLEQMNSFSFYNPSLSEQQKIASFLSLIDVRIQTQNKIIEGLKTLKATLSQRIFSQELRFKDEDGNDFAEWETKTLAEVLDYEQPTNYLVSNTEYDDSYETPVLTAGKTFILGYTNETVGIFGSEKLPVIIFDDFTTAIQFVDFQFKAKSSAMKILKVKDNNNIRFIFEAMQMINYEIGGHGRHWISVFSNLEIPFPSLYEQTKIANLLSSIDSKIDTEIQILRKLEEQKKYLLQNLFV